MKLNYDSLKKLGLTDTKIARILKLKAGLGNKEIFSLKQIDIYHIFQVKKDSEMREERIEFLSAIQRLFSS